MRTSDSDTPKQVRRWFGCIINAAGSMNTTLNLANTWTLCHKRVSILQQLRYYEKKISPVPCFGASHHAIPKYNFSKLDVEYRWLMHTVVAPAWFSNGTSRNFGNAGDQHTRRGQRWNSIRRENVVPVGLWTLLYMIMMVGWVQMGRDFILSPWHNEWSLIFTQAILVQGSNFVLSAFPACPRVFVLCGIRRPSFKSKSVIPRNLVAKPLKDLLDTKWLPRSGMPQHRVLIGRISRWLWNRIFEDSWTSCLWMREDQEAQNKQLPKARPMQKQMRPPSLPRFHSWSQWARLKRWNEPSHHCSIMHHDVWRKKNEMLEMEHRITEFHQPTAPSYWWHEQGVEGWDRSASATWSTCPSPRTNSFKNNPTTDTGNEVPVDKASAVVRGFVDKVIEVIECLVEETLCGVHGYKDLQI